MVGYVLVRFHRFQIYRHSVKVSCLIFQMPSQLIFRMASCLNVQIPSMLIALTLSWLIFQTLS